MGRQQQQHARVDHNDPSDQCVGRADHHEHHKRWPDSLSRTRGKTEC
jgi:hypothetical protein